MASFDLTILKLEKVIKELDFMASIVEGFEDSFHTDMPETGTGHEHLAKGKQSIQDNIS